jgi:hypothetical protein
MPTTTDIRKTIVEQGKTAIEEARKPLFAAVGATNYAFDQLRTQLKDLPTELRKLQERSSERAGRLEPTQVRKAIEEVAGQAREQYETLSTRGEKIVQQLRRDPRITHVFADVEARLDEADEAVTGRPRKTTTVRKAPARKTTTK